jgi:transcriptional regulator with XRE-family HTH domain
MTVAANIQREMEKRDITAPELARRSGINPTGVYDIISGKSRSPKIETLGKIAKGLNVPISSLFEDASEAALRKEIWAVVSLLPESEKTRLLVTARAWLGESTPA